MTLISKLRTFFADDSIPTGLVNADLRRSIQQEVPVAEILNKHPLDMEFEAELKRLDDDGELEEIEEGLD